MYTLNIYTSKLRWLGLKKVISGSIIVTLVATPWINSDALIIPKIIVLVALAAYFLPTLIGGYKSLITDNKTKFLTIISILFIYEMTFFMILLFNMFTVLIFFIIRFNWALSKTNGDYKLASELHNKRIEGLSIKFDINYFIEKYEVSPIRDCSAIENTVTSKNSSSLSLAI